MYRRVNPMSLVALATELVAAAPATASPAKVQLGVDSLFAEALLDAELLDGEGGDAEESTPAAAVAGNGSEKKDHLFLRMGMRPLSVQDLPPLEQADSTAQPQHIIAPVQANAVVASSPSPMNFGLPSLDSAATVDGESVIPEQMNGLEQTAIADMVPASVPVPAPAQRAKLAGPVEATMSEVALGEDQANNFELDLGVPDNAHAQTNSANEGKIETRLAVGSHASSKVGDENADYLSETASDERTVAKAISDYVSVPLTERAVDAAAAVNRTFKAPALTPISDAPPDQHATDPHHPNQAPPVRAQESKGNQRLSTPHVIALDALIRPDTPSHEQGNLDAAPQAAEEPLRWTVDAASPSRQSFADKGERDSSERESAMSPLSPQRPTTFADAIPTRDHAPAARPEGSPASSTREPAPSARPAYIEIKEAPMAPAAPLKRMEMRIPDAQNDIVVQVQERRGAVQVTVRTDDVRAASDIANNVSELTQSLSQQGFRTETDLAKQTDSDRHDAPSKRDWGADPDQRRKKAPQEDFEEYLW